VTLNFAGQTNEGGDAAGLTFDATTQQLWLTNAQNDTTTPDLGQIYQLSWNATNHTVSLVNTYDTAQLVGATPATVDPISAPSTTFLDILPTLATTGTASAATEQGLAVTLLSATPTITDPDNDHLAGASVQITGGTFPPPASNESSAADDLLSVNGVTSGAIGGINITVSYDSATETLTLTGYDTLANYATASATVSITGGTFANDGDVLAATGNGTITTSYDSTNERLILSGADTLAHYQTVLDGVTFNAGENPTGFGSHATRTVTWVLNDGSASNNLSTTQTTTVSITNVNDPPTLSGVTPSVGISISTTVTLSGNVTVTDPDNLNLAGATVAITGGSGDTLATSTAGTGIAASYDSTNERLILSGAATLAHYQQVLDQVTFSSTGSGNRTVSWVLDDGGASNHLSAPATDPGGAGARRGGERVLYGGGAGHDAVAVGHHHGQQRHHHSG
jgi:hypothetical protein